MENKTSHTTELAHADVTDAIISSFFDTVRELGHGFNEPVFRRAVAIVLREKGHHAEEEVVLTVPFRGAIIGSFRADLIVDHVVLVEVKATPILEPYQEAQLLNYLKAAGGGVGLLLNFGRTAAFKRLVSGDPFNSLPNLRSKTSPKAEAGANAKLEDTGATVKLEDK